MGQSWSQPRLAKIKDGSNDKVVMFITGGYDKNEDLRYGNNMNFPNTNPATGGDPVVLSQLNDGGLDGTDGKTSTGSVAPASRYNARGGAMYAIEVAYLAESSGVFTPNFDNAGDIVWEYDGGNNSALIYPIASDMTTGDLDGNSYTDVIYVGDTGGRMWRFDVANTNIASWTGNIIFDSNANAGVLPSGEYDLGRKIFYKPAVTVEGNTRHLWFGTGDRAHPLNHAVVDRLYHVVDTGQVTTDGINEAHLVDLTEDPLQSSDPDVSQAAYAKLYNQVPGPSGEVDYYKGWMIKMDWAFPDETDPDTPADITNDGAYSTVVGEKMLAAPVMFNNEAYFTTYTPKVNPNASDPCAVGNLGSSHLYHLGAKTGEAVFNYDVVNDDGYDDLQDTDRSKGANPGEILKRSDRTRYLGQGIPSGIVTLIDASGRVTMMISSSNRVDTYNAPDIKLISPVYWMQW